MKNKDKSVSSPREINNADISTIKALKKINPSISMPEAEGDNEYSIEIPNSYMKKKYEFGGSKILYLSDIARYIYTHSRDKVFIKKATAIYYEFEISSFDEFENMGIGKYVDQRKRFRDGLFESLPRKLIPLKDNKKEYLCAPPFRVDYKLVERESGSEFKRIKNLKQYSVEPNSEKSEKEEKSLHDPTLKISKIYFSIAKPLFSNFLKKGGQYYVYPKNLYAALYDRASKFGEILNNKKDKKNASSTSEKDSIPSIVDDSTTTKDYIKLLTSPNFMEGYIRGISYLYIHGAGEKETLDVDLEDFCRSVLPGQVREEGKGWRFDNLSEHFDFIATWVMIINSLDESELDFKIATDLSADGKENKSIEPIEKDGKPFLHFVFEHPERVKKRLRKKDLRKEIKQELKALEEKKKQKKGINK